MSILDRQDIDKIIALLEKIAEDEQVDGFAGALIGYTPSGEHHVVSVALGRLTQIRLMEGFGVAYGEIVKHLQGQGAPRVPDGKEGTLWN